MLFRQAFEGTEQLPPPQPIAVEPFGSNVAHVADPTTNWGKQSITMPIFQLSTSPHSHAAPPKSMSSTSYKPTIPQRPQLLPQTPPAN
jgi:hypothetical protein